MYYKCCVPGCASSRQDTILHKFPKCKERLQKWLDFINYCDSLQNKSMQELSGLQVCHKHFEARFVTEKSRLLGVAYSTLVLESEILSGILINAAAITDTVLPIDHQYAKKIHHEHNYCSVQPAQESHSHQQFGPTDVIPSTSEVYNQTSNLEHCGQQQAIYFRCAANYMSFYNRTCASRKITGLRFHPKEE